MNVGTIVTRALNRANLSVSDIGFRELALDFLQEIIEGHWESKNWNFRKRALSLSSGTSEEVSLDKRVYIQNIVPDSVRGSDPVRRIHYQPSHAFYKQHPYQLDSGSPYFFRDGELQGFSTDPTSASAIAFTSSLSNYSTGTVTVVNGLTRIVIATGTVGLDDIGKWIRVASDNKAYKITGIDFKSTSTFFINEPYEGTSAAGASYVFGDIFQKASVLGYSSGQLIEEEVQLNGENSVSTNASFTSIVRISKSDKTHGYVTATSNSGAVTNLVLDPGETETEVQTIKMYPIPATDETINYEAYIKHPKLYRYSDSPLIPSQFHNVLVLDLYIRLVEEFSKSSVAQSVFLRRDELLENMVTVDNNTDQWTIIQNDHEDFETNLGTNLPSTYGIDS